MDTRNLTLAGMYGRSTASHLAWLPLLVALGAAGSVQAAGKPGKASGQALDLSPPRDAAEWTDVRTRARQTEPARLEPSAAQARAAVAKKPVQPYGAGYEARMSSGMSGPVFGAAAAGARAPTAGTGAGASHAGGRGGR